MHNYIYNIYQFISKYIYIRENVLLVIYKYKNILILLVEIELLIFKLIYYLQLNSFKQKYVKLIYHVLYYFSGLNGFKIILLKIYNILLD